MMIMVVMMMRVQPHRTSDVEGGGRRSGMYEIDHVVHASAGGAALRRDAEQFEGRRDAHRRLLFALLYSDLGGGGWWWWWTRLIVERDGRQLDLVDARERGGVQLDGVHPRGWLHARQAEARGAEAEARTVVGLVWLVGAGTEDEVAGIAGVMGEAPETAGGKHVRVGKGGVGVADADLGGKVVGRGGREEIIAIHDTVGEVVEGEGRGRSGGQTVGEGGGTAGKRRGVKAWIGGEPVLRTPCGLADGGHTTDEGRVVEIVRREVGRGRRAGVGGPAAGMDGGLEAGPGGLGLGRVGELGKRLGGAGHEVGDGERFGEGVDGVHADLCERVFRGSGRGELWPGGVVFAGGALLFFGAGGALGDALGAATKETLSLLSGGTDEGTAGGGELVVGGRTEGGGDDGLLAFLGGVAGLVAGSLVEVGEGVSKAVAEIGGATVLVLEDGILDDGGPDGAVLLVASSERTVLVFGERTTFLAAGLFEDGATVWEGGTDLAGEMGLGVGIVFLVCIGEVGTEAGRVGERREQRKGVGTHRSLRSTGERSSKWREGSLRMAFQLPTPHWRER